MSQPDLTNTKFIVRCMGGDKCNHAAGTCTATQTPEDWVLIEGAKRARYIGDASDFRHSYESIKVYRALCDMIAKHEQPPVDRKLLCAREAERQWGMREVKCAEDALLRAIELWEEGFGE